MRRLAYFDHNATAPLDPAVREAMSPWLSGAFGNASSRHAQGRAARQAIDEARYRVAAATGAHVTEVVFTSGGSEANNLFLKGVAACLKPGTLAISAIEHPCILRPAEQLVRRGWRLRRVAVDDQGRVAEADFDDAMQQRPALVSIMLANNETGVIQDVARLASAARAAGGIFHTDAAQALGRIPVDFRRLNMAGVHAMTLSAHKLGGPQGAGVLVIDKSLEIEPLIAGGGHERGLRSGTENVAAIVGCGVACERAAARQAEASARVAALRDRLEAGLRDFGATVFGTGAARLPNTTYFALAGLDGETLVAQLDRVGFSVASGAACSSANPEPSHVLRAMGVAPEIARGAVRASLGGENTEAEVDAFLTALHDTAQGLRRLTAVAI